MNKALPMPVPSVIIITTPRLLRPAPKRISASPAASASLSTTNGRPTAVLRRLATSSPIHDLSTLAAVSATPPRTTAGNVAPTAPSPPNLATTWATTSATDAGTAGCGVSSRYRSAVSVPRSTSTGAPLMPVPPMSIPSTCCATTRSLPLARLSEANSLRSGRADDVSPRRRLGIADPGGSLSWSTGCREVTGLLPG